MDHRVISARVRKGWGYNTVTMQYAMMSMYSNIKYIPTNLKQILTDCQSLPSLAFENDVHYEDFTIVSSCSIDPPTYNNQTTTVINRFTSSNKTRNII